MTEILATLIAGWGAGWFVARSVAGDVLVRGPARWLVTSTSEAAQSAYRNTTKAKSVPVLWACILGYFAILPFRLFFSAFSGAVQCAACSGFWLGLAFGWFSGDPLLSSVFLGLMVMGTNALVDAIYGAAASAEHRNWNAPGNEES